MANNQPKNPQPRKSNIRITWTAAEKYAVTLAIMGYTYDFVEKKTGINHGQTYYRLGILGLTQVRRQFRSGESQLARRFVNTNSTYAMQIVMQHIRQLQTKGQVAAA